jgi:hypothetical protein
MPCRRRYAMARPNCAVEVDHKTGRDVGLAESGFALPVRAAPRGQLLQMRETDVQEHDAILES